jgi:diguanylate cyclase (GGDEF)-like protein
MNILNLKLPARIKIGKRHTDLLDTAKSGIVPNVSLLFLVFFLVAIIGICDYKTEEQISFYIFYSLPIFIASWYIGGWAGIIASLSSSLAWWIVDLKNIETPQLLNYVDAMIRLVYFAGISLIISFLRISILREKHFADTDFLTGLPNRRTFIDRATLEIEKAKKYGRSTTVAYIDLDNFKAVNDQHGHARGDKLLKEIASAIKDDVRPSDIVARMGGDEFLVLFPNTSESEGLFALTHLQHRLKKIAEDHKLQVTSTIGAVTFNNVSSSPEELIKAADRIMYSGKQAGRNTIHHVTQNAAEFTEK